MSLESNIVSATNRSYWVDILRGLAIFGVVCVHSIQITDKLMGTNKSDFFSWLISLGRYGVELFFFISGWLLVSIYGQNGKKLGKAYLSRRAGRIYPLWILFLLVAFIRSEYTNSDNTNNSIKNFTDQSGLFHSTLGVILLSLTFTLFASSSLWNAVIPGGWSIQAEVAHYLLFPIIRNRSLNLVIKLVTLVNFFTILAHLLRIQTPTNFSLIFRIIDMWMRLSIYNTFCFFLIGILSFLLYEQARKYQVSRIKFSSLGVSPITFGFFCVSFIVVGNHFEALGYLILMIVLSFSIQKNKIISKFFRFLGRYSYFIYFMHFLCLAVLHWVVSNYVPSKGIFWSQQLFFILVLIYTLSISSILAIPSWKYFEKPIIKIAHKVK